MTCCSESNQRIHDQNSSGEGVDFDISYDKELGITFSKSDKTEGLYVLDIPKNVKSTKPITIHHRPTGQLSELRLSVNVGEGAEVEILEEIDDQIHSPIFSQRTKIKAEKYSYLKYVRLQNTKADHWIEFYQTEVAEGARVHLVPFHFGSAKVSSRIVQKTTGRNAKIDTDIVAKAVDKKVYDFDCTHHFNAAVGRGEVTMKGVALDEAKLKLNGMIQITEKGGETETFLGETILNLSQKTTVDAAPALEIDTNDVKAGHSAGIHNLSDEDLIYLSSRGLEKKEARTMMMKGFLKESLEKVWEMPSIYKAIEKLI